MRHRILNWLPALLMMLVIFWFSSQPSYDLPNFEWADYLVKKGGHVLGYGLLALSYWQVFRFKADKRWLAWLLAVLFATTDEFHQSFVPGRHPSIWDILMFDNVGALMALWLAQLYRKTKRPDAVQPVAGEPKH